MIQTPFVTINIPTYNQEKYVARAIESALAQDYPNLEVVVCDDCSGDGTFTVANRYAARGARITRNEQNLGRVGNYRRMLYDLARGEWVCNLDGDDFYDDPCFISAAIERILANPGVVLYAGGCKSLNEATGEVTITPSTLPVSEACISGVDYVLGYPGLGLTQHFAVLYNRALALETDFYTLDSLGTDTDSLCRLALKGKVYARRHPSGVWTYHDTNASYTITDESVGKEVAMLEHIAAALADHVDEPVWRRWLARQLKAKRRFAQNQTLARLPTRAAWSYLWRNRGISLFHLKEAIKLILRTLRLRRSPLCAE